MDKLTQIIQNYIGMNPADRSCSTWNEMQSKMEEEINALFTPTTVESPFSKDELEEIGGVFSGRLNIFNYDSPTCKSIITKANHLLTNANEFPKMMEVSDFDGNTWKETLVYGIFDGQFMAKIKGDGEYYGYINARPIEQKSKELKDLKEGDFFYSLVTEKGVTFGEKYCVISKDANTVLFIDDDGDKHSMYLDKDLSKHFSVQPPTTSQITAAEEAAINEVKARFEGLRKGGSNG